MKALHSSDMPNLNSCPRCGAKLRPQDSEGFCTRCLLTEGLAGSRAEPTVTVSAEIETLVAERKLRTLNQDGGEVRAFGDYELLEEIARGGMGVVYRARQRSLGRVVAIKMLLSGPLSSPELLKRFRIEASAAAGLQHPNIVAIHEVGVHHGLPYFAMDFVDGRSLAKLVAGGPLPVKRAAVYLRTIAKAIDYAHDCGLLHRDLKPSNVIIDTLDEPHVTDFGLAKRLDEDSDLTLSGQVLGSPNYMPPEQAGARRGQLSRCSDVYALGAMLYHLLTGRPPFVGETVADTLSAVINAEPVSPRLLNPSVPRDLDTVCLRCLEKEPGKRYVTAKAFADELKRFLDGEPVQARPVSLLEKLARWCRRKPGLAGTLSGGLLLLLILFIGGPLLTYRINQERKRAEMGEREQERLRAQVESELIKSRQVARFFRDMLNGVGPSVALGRDTALLREILDRTVERAGKELTGHPEVDGELRSTIGSIYLELGDSAKAESMYRTALRLRQEVFGQETLEVCECLDGLSRSLWRLGKESEAEPYLRESLRIRLKLLGNSNPLVATSMNYLGTLFYVQRKPNEAERFFRTALAMRRQTLNAHDPDLAKSMHNLGTLLRDEGKLEEAEALLREAMAAQTRQLAVGHPDLVMTRYNLGMLLMKQGRAAEAEPLLREAQQTGKKVLGESNPILAKGLADAGAALLEKGKPTEAEPLLREALRVQKQFLPAGHPDLVSSLRHLGTALRTQGHAAEADTLLNEARLQSQRSGTFHPNHTTNQ